MKKTNLSVCVPLMLFLFSFMLSHAQKDSVFLSPKDFFNYLLINHPAVKQAQLLSASAKENVRLAKGSLDPSLNATFSEKKYDKKTYYSLWEADLKVPTWIGVDLKAGFDQNSGIYLNNENYTPENGLGFLGVSIPLAQNLLIDERRLAIKQARIMQNIAEAEKTKLINKILLEAAKDYWEWYFAFKTYQLNKEAYELAANRLTFTKLRVIGGDAAAIDSVEASMYAQNFSISSSKSFIDFKNAGLRLSNYLWIENAVPMEIGDNTFPLVPEKEVDLPVDSVQRLHQYAAQNHPDIRKIQFKSDQLKLDKRYSKNKLLPKLNLEYNFLNSGIPLSSLNGSEYLSNYYKAGANFYFPLFLRKERAKLNIVKLKITENNLSLQQTNREIMNEIEASFNEFITYQTLLKQQQTLVENAITMRNAESINFNNGESSMFLVNSREQTLINYRLKYVEMFVKSQKALYQLYWSAGDMNPAISR